MENMKNIEITEKIRELFKEFAGKELCDAWLDSFSAEEEDAGVITVVYHGAKDIKKFKKQCGKIIATCVETAFGQNYKVKITKKSSINLSPNARKNIKAVKFFAVGMIWVCIATFVIVVMCNYIGNRNFRETFYAAGCIKADSTVRVMQISDLHGTSYGRDNQKLIKRVQALEPDVIILTGDIVDDINEDAEYVQKLAGELSKVAPSYYIYGNSEVKDIIGNDMTLEELDEKFGFSEGNRDTAVVSEMDDFGKKLEASGVKVLKNQMDTIEVRGMKLDVYGVLTSNPSAFWHYAGKSFSDYIHLNPDHLKITAVHEPEIFENLTADSWGDIMLAGHTHGGIIRVPVLGPLFSNDGEILPERSDRYAYGRHDILGRPLFVSGGMENSNVFRINNQPELVVIDINKF